MAWPFFWAGEPCSTLENHVSHAWTMKPCSNAIKPCSHATEPCSHAWTFLSFSHVRMLWNRLLMVLKHAPMLCNHVALFKRYKPRCHAFFGILPRYDSRLFRDCITLFLASYAETCHIDNGNMWPRYLSFFTKLFNHVHTQLTTVHDIDHNAHFGSMLTCF